VKTSKIAPPWSPSRAREAARADLARLERAKRGAFTLRAALRNDWFFNDAAALRGWLTVTVARHAARAIALDRVLRESGV